MPGLFYKRNLPHWQPDGAALFVTWRLYGSLPKQVWESLRTKESPFTGREFREVDKTLDAAETGPVWLKNPRVADSVVEALRHGAQAQRRYILYAWVVMANHVHVLLRPEVALSRITQGIKGYTARKANRILKHRGPFWQDESFDHFVRSEAEFRRIKSYIERNPVTAGLVRNAEDWPWSSSSG